MASSTTTTIPEDPTTKPPPFPPQQTTSRPSEYNTHASGAASTPSSLYPPVPSSLLDRRLPQLARMAHPPSIPHQPVDLDSAFKYLNTLCNPLPLEIDTDKMGVRVPGQKT